MLQYSMDDYVKFYESGDMVNAIAIWDHLSAAIYHDATGQREATFDASLPPIFSSFMPKSGGTFLYNRMIETVGYSPCMWGITRPNSLSEFYPVAGAVEQYRRGGVFAHTHAVPSPYFQSLAERHQIYPLWVHVRHPAECCLAGYHHYQGIGQGEGETAVDRRMAIEAERAWLESQRGVRFDDLERFMRKTIGFYARWLGRWVDYAEQYPERVYFTFFDELTDAGGLIQRVLADFGHARQIPEVPGRLPSDRRRDSGSDDWREGLREQTIEQVEIASRAWDRAQSLRQLA